MMGAGGRRGAGTAAVPSSADLQVRVRPYPQVGAAHPVSLSRATVADARARPGIVVHAWGTRGDAADDARTSPVARSVDRAAAFPAFAPPPTTRSLPIQGTRSEQLLAPQAVPGGVGPSAGAVTGRTERPRGAWYLAAAGLDGWKEVAPAPGVSGPEPGPEPGATATGEAATPQAGRGVRPLPEAADRLVGVDPEDRPTAGVRPREPAPPTRRQRRLAEADSAVRSRDRMRARRRYRRRSWQQEVRVQTWQRAVVGSVLVAVSGALGLAAVQHPVSLPSRGFNAPRTNGVHQPQQVFAPIAVTAEEPQADGPLDSPLSGVASGDAKSLSLQIQRSKEYARSKMTAFGWTDPNEMACLDRLWSRESGWRVDATNPKSGAYGIPQALPASKLASAGADWRTNPRTQIDWGLAHIRDQYGSPSKAWAHSRSTGSS